jgi:hypothetical protein
MIEQQKRNKRKLEFLLGYECMRVRTCIQDGMGECVEIEDRTGKIMQSVDGPGVIEGKEIEAEQEEAKKGLEREEWQFTFPGPGRRS